MTTEHVHIWRPDEQDRVLLMKGHTSHYAIEPRGEYIFGVIDGQPMRARRGRAEWLVAPGQLMAWDPSEAHGGVAVDGRPWTARLVVVEVADLLDLVADPESDGLADVSFPEPVLADPELAKRFVRLHAALEAPTTRLEREVRLAEWLRDVGQRHGVSRRSPALTHRDDRALRLALEYLADCPDRNVGLGELAGAAGVGAFRLIRLFRDHTRLPPHALQIAYRICAARRLLEAGESVAATAAATGFADQSHLHRHFQAAVGWTPAQYQRRIKSR